MYTDDEKTEASLQPTHGEGHSCFDPSAPHFHMYSPRGGRDKRVRIAAACGREMGRGDAAACGRAAPRPRDGSRADPRRRRGPRVRRAALSMRSARFPHKEKLNSVLGSSKTALVVSDAFVVEVYFPPFVVLGGIAAVGGLELVGAGVLCALRKLNGC